MITIGILILLIVGVIGGHGDVEIYSEIGPSSSLLQSLCERNTIFKLKYTKVDAWHAEYQLIRHNDNMSDSPCDNVARWRRWNKADYNLQDKILTSYNHTLNCSNAYTLCLRENDESPGVKLIVVPKHWAALPSLTLFCLVFSLLCLTLGTPSGSKNLALASIIITYITLFFDALIPAFLLLLIVGVTVLGSKLILDTPKEKLIIAVAVLSTISFIFFYSRTVEFITWCLDGIAFGFWWILPPYIASNCVDISGKFDPNTKIVSLATFLVIFSVEYFGNWYVGLILVALVVGFCWDSINSDRRQVQEPLRTAPLNLPNGRPDEKVRSQPRKPVQVPTEGQPVKKVIGYLFSPQANKDYKNDTEHTTTNSSNNKLPEKTNHKRKHSPTPGPNKSSKKE